MKALRSLPLAELKGPAAQLRRCCEKPEDLKDVEAALFSNQADASGIRSFFRAFEVATLRQLCIKIQRCPQEAYAATSRKVLVQDLFKYVKQASFSGPLINRAVSVMLSRLAGTVKVCYSNGIVGYVYRQHICAIHWRFTPLCKILVALACKSQSLPRLGPDCICKIVLLPSATALYASNRLLSIAAAVHQAAVFEACSDAEKPRSASRNPVPDSQNSKVLFHSILETVSLVLQLVFALESLRYLSPAASASPFSSMQMWLVCRSCCNLSMCNICYNPEVYLA